MTEIEILNCFEVRFVVDSEIFKTCFTCNGNVFSKESERSIFKDYDLKFTQLFRFKYDRDPGNTYVRWYKDVDGKTILVYGAEVEQIL